MKNIEYIGKTKIKKLICSGYQVLISDFEYTSEDGEKYQMCINRKGFDGRWHIIKSMTDNKLYGTNNLWTDIKKSEYNAMVIESEISEENIRKIEGIIYLNKIEFFEEEEIEEIKKACEESIKKRKENEYIISNTKYYLKMFTDSEDCWFHLYSKPNIKTEEINYYVHYGCIYGDDEERYETLDDGISKCVEIIENHDKEILNDETLENEEIGDKLLGWSKEREINELIKTKLKMKKIGQYKILNTLGGKYVNYVMTDELYKYIKQNKKLKISQL